MNCERKRELYQLVEACQHTDNSDVEAEKTEVIVELMAEVEALTKEHAEAIQRMEELKTEASPVRDGEDGVARTDSTTGPSLFMTDQLIGEFCHADKVAITRVHHTVKGVAE
jgi:hypothetical protein